jgi:hypothetical protein
MSVFSASKLQEKWSILAELDFQMCEEGIDATNASSGCKSP